MKNDLFSLVFDYAGFIELKSTIFLKSKIEFNIKPLHPLVKCI